MLWKTVLIRILCQLKGEVSVCLWCFKKNPQDFKIEPLIRIYVLEFFFQLSRDYEETVASSPGEV